jgi:hypothetical protein
MKGRHLSSRAQREILRFQLHRKKSFLGKGRNDIAVELID